MEQDTINQNCNIKITFIVVLTKQQFLSIVSTQLTQLKKKSRKYLVYWIYEKIINSKSFNNNYKPNQYLKRFK